MLAALEPDIHLVDAARRAQPAPARRDPGDGPPGGRHRARPSSRPASPTASARPSRGALARASRTRRPRPGRHRLAAHHPRQPAPLAARAAHARARAARRLRPPPAQPRPRGRSSPSTSRARWPTASCTPRCSARVLARLPALRTSVVAFDTAVVDLTAAARTIRSTCCSASSSAAAPTSNSALAYCRRLITRPARHRAGPRHRPVRGRRSPSEMRAPRRRAGAAPA